MFRDDVEALRARIATLEEDLARARDRIAELEPIEQERDRLRARLAQLEPVVPPPPPPFQPRQERTRPSKRGLPWGFLALGGVGITAGAIYLVSENDVDLSLGGLDHDARPTLGMLELDRDPDPPPIQGNTQGDNDAPEECTGYIPDEPQFVLRTTGPTIARVSASSSNDLVMVMLTSDNHTLCNDDGNGHDPVITAVLPAGDHRVWIGTYNEDVSSDFGFSVSASRASAMPDESGLATRASPSEATLQLVHDPQDDTVWSFEGAITGFVAASRLRSGCPGYVPLAPNAVIQVPQAMAVSIDAQSANHDLVLLVQAPDGSWLCDDDGGPGNSPRIGGSFRPGAYRVWVGELSLGPRDTPYQAGVRAYLPSSTPTEGSIPLDQDRVHNLDVALTGPQMPATLIGASSTCELDIPRRPLFVAYASEPREVRMVVIDGDVGIVVRHPDGHVECTNERSLRATWGAGNHAIYLGHRSGSPGPERCALSIAASTPSLVPYSP